MVYTKMLFDVAFYDEADEMMGESAGWIGTDSAEMMLGVAIRGIMILAGSGGNSRT